MWALPATFVPTEIVAAEDESFSRLIKRLHNARAKRRTLSKRPEELMPIKQLDGGSPSVTRGDRQP